MPAYLCKRMFPHGNIRQINVLFQIGIITIDYIVSQFAKFIISAKNTNTMIA